MPINLYKLIRSLLITFTRDVKLVELIRVLTAQVESAFNAFNLQAPDWMYKVNANASVISLTHHIKRELDVDVVITELDGTPIDFLVTVNGFVDQSKLKALIDSYKLSGRSFLFENGDLTYYCQFINHACEKELIDNLITMINGVSGLEISAQFAVTSPITVSVHLYDVYGNTDFVEAIFQIGDVQAYFHYNQPMSSNEILSISVNCDETYRYSFDDTIINNG